MQQVKIKYNRIEKQRTENFTFRIKLKNDFISHYEIEIARI